MSLTDIEIANLSTISTAGQQKVIQASDPIIADITVSTPITIGRAIVEQLKATIPHFVGKRDDEILNSITGMRITPKINITLGTIKVNESFGTELAITAGLTYYNPSVRTWKMMATGAGDITLELFTG